MISAPRHTVDVKFTIRQKSCTEHDGLNHSAHDPRWRMAHFSAHRKTFATPCGKHCIANLTVPYNMALKDVLQSASVPVGYDVHRAG